MEKIRSLIKKFDRDDYLVWTLIVTFCISRILLFVLGFEFDMGFLNTAWQTIDTSLLRTDLWRSVWYLHSQPPLFNLFIGIILKLFPTNFALVFEMIFHGLGLVLMLALYFIIRNLTNNRWLSLIFALGFVISPSLLLFENFFFYDFAVLVISVIVLFFFQKFTITNKIYYLFAFFFAAAFLVLTRRIFHLVWLSILVGILLYFYRSDWKRIILTFLFPLMLVVFWYGKNLYYFGKFDASSWTGMGFFKTATYSMSQDERQKLFDEGVVSEHIFYGKDPFQIPVNTSTAFKFDKEVLAAPVVGSYMKKEGGINYNYYPYIDLSHQLMSEFISIVKHHPTAYLKGVAVTSIIFFSPASGYFAASENNNVFYTNYEIIKKWDNFFDRVVFGQPLSWGGEALKNYLAGSLNIKKTEAWRLLSPGIFLIVVYLISVFYGLRIIFRKNAISVYGLAVYLVVIFLVLNILYVSAAGILAEAGENQRHRFMIESLNWILFALFLQNLFFSKKR